MPTGSIRASLQGAGNAWPSLARLSGGSANSPLCKAFEKAEEGSESKEVKQKHLSDPPLPSRRAVCAAASAALLTGVALLSFE